MYRHAGAHLVLGPEPMLSHPTYSASLRQKQLIKLKAYPWEYMPFLYLGNLQNKKVTFD